MPNFNSSGQPGSAMAFFDASEESLPFRFGRRDHWINLIFWSLLGAVMAANFLSNDFEPAGYRRAIPEAIYWLSEAYLWAAATPVIFWLVWWFGTRRTHRVLGSVVLLGAVLGITVLVGNLQDFVWEHVLGFPSWEQIFSRGGQPQPGESGGPSLWIRLDEELVTCAAIFAAGFLREHLLRSRAREEHSVVLQARAAQSDAHAAQLQAQLAKARLAVLRSQLNPHFLFNSLNALSALIEDDTRSAQRMITRLSELLRYALEAREEEETPLHQELAITERYLEILEIRFQGRLQTRVNAAPEVQDALVPNLILQPLVENAMKHGVGRAGGRGWIEVDVRRADDRLVLTVSDSGGGEGAHVPVEPGMEGSGTGLGLQNTRARLQELYGAEQHLRLAPRPEGGMVVEIVLPFHARSGGSAAPEPARQEAGTHV